MNMLPFAKDLALALVRRHTSYLQHADAGAAATGENPPMPVVYIECLAYVLAEVLLNVRMALKSGRHDASYTAVVTRALDLAEHKWASSDAPTGAQRPVPKGDPS